MKIKTAFWLAGSLAVLLGAAYFAVSRPGGTGDESGGQRASSPATPTAAGNEMGGAAAPVHSMSWSESRSTPSSAFGNGK